MYHHLLAQQRPGTRDCDRRPQLAVHYRKGGMGKCGTKLPHYKSTRTPLDDADTGKLMVRLEEAGHVKIGHYAGKLNVDLTRPAAARFVQQFDMEMLTPTEAARSKSEWEICSFFNLDFHYAGEQGIHDNSRVTLYGIQPDSFKDDDFERLRRQLRDGDEDITPMDDFATGGTHRKFTKRYRELYLAALEEEPALAELMLSNFEGDDMPLMESLERGAIFRVLRAYMRRRCGDPTANPECLKDIFRHKVWAKAGVHQNACLPGVAWIFSQAGFGILTALPLPVSKLPEHARSVFGEYQHFHCGYRCFPKGVGPHFDGDDVDNDARVRRGVKRKMLS